MREYCREPGRSAKDITLSLISQHLQFTLLCIIYVRTIGLIAQAGQECAGSMGGSEHGRGSLPEESLGRFPAEIRPVSEPGRYERGFEHKQHVLSLRAVVQTIRRGIWAIVLVTVLCVGITLGVTLLQTPSYETSTDVLIRQEQQESSTPPNLENDVNGLQKMTRTVAKAIDSEPTAEAVIRRLDLATTPEALLEGLRVEQLPETQFIRITYESSSPEIAKEVADAFGEVFSEQAAEVSPSSATLSAVVWQRASVPDEPVSPKLPINIALAVVVGLVLGVGLAFLLRYLDNTGAHWAK